MNILEIKMQENDANAETIGEYLRLLLHAVWVEGECFNGKRPFGNSGWERELYTALALAGVVASDVDPDGQVEDVDTKAAHLIISDAINQLIE